MGTASVQICDGCATRFEVRAGGGLFFDMLHCGACGKA